MDWGSKYNSSILTGLVFSVLILGLSGSQNVYAGNGPPPCPHQPVWDAGGGADTNWSNAANWLDGETNANCVPASPYDPTINDSGNRVLIGCNIEDEVEFDVPRAVTVNLDIDFTFRNNGDRFQLDYCEDSLIIIDEGKTLRFESISPTSPMNVRFQPEGDITVLGTLEMVNDFANDDDVRIELDNDGTMTIADTGTVTLANNGILDGNETQTGNFINLVIEVDNDRTITTSGLFEMINTAAVTSDNGARVEIEFDDNDGLLEILDGGEVNMINEGKLTDTRTSSSSDIEIKFDDNDETIDIMTGGKLLMENTGDLNATNSVGLGSIDIEIEFDDNDDTVINGGTLEMKNSGDAEGACTVDIVVQFDDNEGPLTNSGTIIMENTGDATASCGDTSGIEVEMENDHRFTNTGTFTLKNTGNADDIQVSIDNMDKGLILNRGETTITNEGDARDLHLIGIFNDDDDDRFENDCGGTLEIKTTDASATEPEVGISNFGVFNNRGDATIKIDDAGTVTENEAIVVLEGNPINFLDECFTDAPSSTEVLYSCSGANDEGDEFLRVINQNDASTIKKIPLIPPPGFEVDRCTALTSGPGNQLFGSYRFDCPEEADEGCNDSGRHLVTIDPNSGFMTDIGRFDVDGVAGMTFTPEGILFAVTGNQDPSETLFTVDTSDASTTEVCEFDSDSSGEEIAFANGRIYRVSGSDFESTDTSSVEGTCSVEDHGIDGSLDDEEGTSMTYWPTMDIFMVASFDELYELTRPQSPGVSTFVGKMDHLSGGLAIIIEVARTSGSSGHEPPTIGKAIDGVRQVVDGGMAIDEQTWTVTQPYHQEFELLQMLSSPHTISNVIHCDKGVQYCNYIAVGFMGLDDDFNNPVMTVSASKDHLGTWTLGWFDPDNYISDPDDAVPADIVFVPQIIDNKLLGTSFTIDFKNKDTGQLKLGIQVRDSYNGVRNFYFNEGVEFIDADAYPTVQTEYEAPLEVEPLCFGQNNPDRNSCAFAKIKDWATQNAQETLRQMMGNQYEYEQ
jgi:hypothetical protein